MSNSRPGIRYWEHRILASVFCILCLFLCSISPMAFANESLQIAGMGGAFTGLHSLEGGIFGNSAGLIGIQDNNLSVALSTQDLAYKGLSLSEDEQTSTLLSFKLTPSIYYSGTIKGVGISLGYVDDADSRNIIKIIDTKAGYAVGERKFTSETDAALEYDLFREQGAALSLGYPINQELAVGIKLKYKHRTVKEGVIHRPLILAAVHGEDVNRNDPVKLLPAIIDNLDIGDSIDRFISGEESSEDVIADLTGSGLDVDLGMQAKLNDSGDVIVGFVLEHLFQRRVVRPQSAGIRLGVGARPTKWMTAAIDVRKSLDTSGLDVNLGWEVSYRWDRWFSGGIMIRNGFAHESSEDSSLNKTKDKLSVGIGLILGESHWDYALIKPLDSSPIFEATHMFSSTVRF